MANFKNLAAIILGIIPIFLDSAGLSRTDEISFNDLEFTRLKGSVGDSGTVLMTVDSGYTWSRLDVNISATARKSLSRFDAWMDTVSHRDSIAFEFSLAHDQWRSHLVDSQLDTMPCDCRNSMGIHSS
jgi:photosystem II stability/assembly factor-like uncharacterized protein